jgi:hypothetical protein
MGRVPEPGKAIETGLDGVDEVEAQHGQVGQVFRG